MLTAAHIRVVMEREPEPKGTVEYWEEIIEPDLLAAAKRGCESLMIEFEEDQQDYAKEYKYLTKDEFCKLAIKNGFSYSENHGWITLKW